MAALSRAPQLAPDLTVLIGQIGIDISGHTSKTLDGFLGEPWDYVITVCDSANERCPVFPGARRRIHWSFDDPSAATGSEEERLTVFRRVRDQIAGRLREWLGDGRA